MDQLERDIRGITLLSSEDTWSCAIGEDGVYSVKASYRFLSSNFLPEVVLSANVSRVLKNQWLSLAPTK
ncbi:hypothetical protein A2U01_0069987, partial [Trifolium medium]|nr:hypothetical protein [Trifolium medium]